MALKKESKARGVEFWYSAYENTLPMPYARKNPWTGKITFLSNLNQLEKLCEETGSVSAYKGKSTCRICKKENGSKAFGIGKWFWPEGLSHYVREHNVKPDKEFVKYVIQKKF